MSLFLHGLLIQRHPRVLQRKQGGFNLDGMPDLGGYGSEEESPTFQRGMFGSIAKFLSKKLAIGTRGVRYFISKFLSFLNRTLLARLEKLIYCLMTSSRLKTLYPQMSLIRQIYPRITSHILLWTQPLCLGTEGTASPRKTKAGAKKGKKSQPSTVEGEDIIIGKGLSVLVTHSECLHPSVAICRRIRDLVATGRKKKAQHCGEVSLEALPSLRPGGLAIGTGGVSHFISKFLSSLNRTLLAPLEKLISLLDDIFEAEDTLPPDVSDTAELSQHYFSHLTVDCPRLVNGRGWRRGSPRVQVRVGISQPLSNPYQYSDSLGTARMSVANCTSESSAVTLEHLIHYLPSLINHTARVSSNVDPCCTHQQDGLTHTWHGWHVLHQCHKPLPSQAIKAHD